VLTPGVDVIRFAPDEEAGLRVRRALGWPADAFVVGYLGRFIEAKGLPLLCRALDEASVPWHALFVGGGALESDLHAFGRRYPARVHVATGVPHGDVPGWLNAMSALCAPSQTTPAWKEQFGRMLIEAMACGVPVLASDSGEIPFVIADAGVLLPEADVSAWTAAIDRLGTDADARTRAGRAGRERAVGEFAWDVVARRHLAFFEELAA
jgi:glycosyltransferase involved in cell wall biosynthesis